jgi:hypothetical protein
MPVRKLFRTSLFRQAALQVITASPSTVAGKNKKVVDEAYRLQQARTLYDSDPTTKQAIKQAMKAIRHEQAQQAAKAAGLSIQAPGDDLQAQSRKHAGQSFPDDRGGFWMNGLYHSAEAQAELLKDLITYEVESRPPGRPQPWNDRAAGVIRSDEPRYVAELQAWRESRVLPEVNRQLAEIAAEQAQEREQ